MHADTGTDGADVLLVEDNHGDVHLIETTFEERALPGELHTVQTGDAALDWLYRRGEFADAPVPDLVLLDLNLPAVSGQALLEEVKSDPRLKRTPVVVLTGSDSESDLIAAYEAGANAYLLKPVDPDAFADRLQSITEFWLSTAVLPPAAPTDAE
ncbi:response regulator [Natrinema sp. 1APR25-10V2]|uniref:response regulator n=1 Tax=Natrinema sp. 1APR25-10V2 TaxID=2951081 RepID=UPI002876980C|nr:response regulator [Natrinema sp. 1APR25-10V2]MDS0475409.1 response regulator [Natrinema sp. 1APR25-10V2]